MRQVLDLTWWCGPGCQTAGVKLGSCRPCSAGWSTRSCASPARTGSSADPRPARDDRAEVGKPRVNPVGNGLSDDRRTFWLVAEQGGAPNT